MLPDYAQSRILHKVEFYDGGLRPDLARQEDRAMKEDAGGLSPEAHSMQRNLKLWRKAKKYTLRALAEHTENKISTLSSWENGKRAMSLDDLRKLAGFYGIHPAALLMTPEEAGTKIPQMQQAASIVQGMSEEAASTWLTMGKLASKRPSDS